MRNGIQFSLAMCMLASSAMAGINVDTRAPKEFESLEKLRPTMVNVSFGGESLGAFAAHYSPTSLIFDDPQSIVNAIPNVKDAAALSKALADNLEHHAELLCIKGSRENCGNLQPEIAGVIFNERELSAELFINKDFLNVSDNNGARYLPLPERRIASIYGFNGAIAGTNESSANFALSNQALFSYGEGRLISQSTATNEGLRFDTAAASIDRPGWEAQAGLFRSRGMQLVSDRDIAGISYSTSLRTRLDHRKIEGNSIVLYLARRSLVSIYREGRLYSTRLYEVGNQTIDTSELPEGAYNITLRVQEMEGVTRDEVRFYSKSPDIPPQDAPVYYAQAGVIRKSLDQDKTLPELTPNPLVRMGTVRRVADNAGIDIGGLGLKDRVALEAGSFVMIGGIQARITALASTQSDKGMQWSAIYMAERFSASADIRRIWATDKYNTADTVITPLKQAVSNVSYAITPDVTLGLRANYAQLYGVTHKYLGPSAEWFIWREGEGLLSLSGDAGKTEKEYVANAMLRFSMRFGKYGASGGAGYTHSKGNTGAISNARVWYDDTTPESSLLLGASAQHSPQADYMSADADYRNNLGRVRGVVQNSWGEDKNIISYGGNFATSMAYVEDYLKFGGDRAETSAVLVELSGSAQVPMKILVGGVERGTVDSGKQQAIYLPPYQTYNIRLAPLNEGMLDYDTSERKVTLYPGNVSRQQWQVDKLYVVLAKLVTKEGVPLAMASLQENNNVMTGANGRIQAELKLTKRLTFITQDDGACEVELPAQEAVNGVVIYKKPLVCEAIPVL